MAKKKKQVVVVQQPLPPQEGRWYWCVNCGHHGDYGKVKKRGIKCEECDWEDVCFFTEIELFDEHLDNVWPERFKVKEVSPKDHVEMMETVKHAKVLLKQLDEKYPKQTLADRLAEIKNL